MGGSSSGVYGHGLMLALHLQRQLKNTSKLIQLLRDDRSTLVSDIHCVKPLQDLIQVSKLHLVSWVASQIGLYLYLSALRCGTGGSDNMCL